MDNLNQPISSQPPPETPVQQASYGKRNWLKWVLIYLLIAAVVYGAVYFLFLSKHGSDPYSANTQGPNEITQPTQAFDETANWKTYTNIQYGYSLKYPPELNIKSSIETESIEHARILILGNPPQPGIGIVGGVVKKDKESLFMTANRDLALYGSPKISVISEKPIDSHPAIYLEASIMFNNKQAKQYYVYVEKNSALAISLYSEPIYPGNEGAKTLFDQILSTFRFTQ